MALNASHYKGRPQALVKHTFLNEYLPALVNKICTHWTTFEYIDGFAGPWQAADEAQFSDTSFGIALQAMSDAKKFQAARGRIVKMVAHLVEQEHDAFVKLPGLADQFPDIEVRPYEGDFHHHFPSIMDDLIPSAFCFSFVDPKGVSLDLGLLKPLLSRPSSEVLVNFMFDFVNRFASHPNASVVETMNKLIPGTDWRPLLDLAKAQGAPPNEREQILLDGFRKGLSIVGDYDFVTSLMVQKPLADRTYYHLVFGTRSSSGLSVFRDSQIKALETQAGVRSTEKSKAKTAKTGQDDLFGGSDAIPIDPSSKEIEDGRSQGILYAKEIIDKSPEGVLWGVLWPQVLTEFTIKQSELAKAINNMRRNGEIEAPNWPSPKHRKPNDKQLFRPTKNP